MYAAEVCWSTGRGIFVMKTLKDRLIKWWQEAIRFFNQLQWVTMSHCRYQLLIGVEEIPCIWCALWPILTQKHSNTNLLLDMVFWMSRSFSRNKFLPCTSNTLLLGSVDFDTEISVRQAAREQSIGTGQGFLKCTCKSGCIKKTCKCLKAGMLWHNIVTSTVRHERDSSSQP